jgi:hypothetical protein
MANVTIGMIKKGDFIKCGKEGKEDIWKVSEISFHTIGSWKDKVKDLIMVNKEGKEKHYAFLEKKEEFLNSIFVKSYEHSDLELGFISKLNEILSENKPPSLKLKEIKELIN